MATFGYGRVSTANQTTENQRRELEQAGYALDFWFEDAGVSGKTCARQRPQFVRLLDRIRAGETLVVAKLDRLGRDAVDVLATVRELQARGVAVIVHQLGRVDLTSPAGRLLLGHARKLLLNRGVHPQPPPQLRRILHRLQRPGLRFPRPLA